MVINGHFVAWQTLPLLKAIEIAMKNGCFVHLLSGNFLNEEGLFSDVHLYIVVNW